MSQIETIEKEHDVPAGYKKTAVGVIPEEWAVVRLFSINESLLSGISVNSEDLSKKKSELGILKTSAISNGNFFPDKNKLISDLTELSRAKLNPIKGKLLISRMNTPELVGACAYINKTRTDLFIPDRLWLASFDTDLADPRWLNFLLNNKYYRVQIKQRANGTSNSMKNISKGSLLSMLIPLPPLSEQQKIAQILSTWDEAIEHVQGIIKLLKKRNKGLAQQLLTGKKRLNGFEGEWENEPLETHFSERKETGFVNLPLLSLGEAGVIPQNESNKKDTSNVDKHKYKRICLGDIGYNTMRMWQGRSALSKLEGIVSPAYTIVTPKEKTDVQFFSYLFKLNVVVHRFYRNSQGLVNDTLNCKFKDFKIVKVDVPPTIEEQQAISKTLYIASQEVHLYKNKLTTLKDQKKGLMQKLLTGKVRVKTNKINMSKI